MPDSLLQLPVAAPAGLRTRWRDRRRLQRIDRLGVRLARLDATTVRFFAGQWVPDVSRWS